jgi:hypothetical protein
MKLSQIIGTLFWSFLMRFKDYPKQTVLILLAIAFVTSITIAIFSNTFNSIFNANKKDEITLPTSGITFFEENNNYGYININKKITYYKYLKNFFIFPNILRTFHRTDPPTRLLKADLPGLKIFPTEFSPDHLSFMLVSDKKSSFEIKNMYIKLNGYATCDLRNEHGELSEKPKEASYNFYISEDHNIYPIYPLERDFNSSYWIYQRGDFDEFDIKFDSKPYILYLITINLDYFDLTNYEIRHTESNEFALIRTLNGNAGGCVDIDDWFTNEMRTMPEQHRYDECISRDVYCFLTANISDNNSEMTYLFFKNEAFLWRSELVEGVVRERSENPVFMKNYEKLARVITDRAITDVAEETEPIPTSQSQQITPTKSIKPPQSIAPSQSITPPQNIPTPTKSDSAGKFTLQVSSLRNKESAYRLVKKLQAKGYASRVEVADMGDKGIYYRVRVGSFVSRQEGLEFAVQFQKKEQLKGVVVRSKGW